MKKLMMSMLLAVAIVGLALAQTDSLSTQKKSTQTQMDKDKGYQSQSQYGQTQTDKDKGWQKIGEKTIDLSKGHDELALTSPEKFKAIKVKADNASVDLTDLQLFYDSGDKQDVTIETPITANSESKVINLNETNHGLKRIVFNTKSTSGLTSSYDKNMNKDMSKKNKEDKSMSKSNEMTSSNNVKVEVWGLRADVSK